MDSSPKNETFCHHLLILKLFQTCMSFFLLEDILKNADNKSDDSSHWLTFFPHPLSENNTNNKQK